MANENTQKIKLLKLMEMLRRETDEEHPMRRKEVCERLEEMGISCDIRTLSKDMKVLNDFGYEVMSYFVDHEKCYYVPENNFSDAELKILIDAIQAASFITDKKTAELIDKVAALGGSHKAELLKDNMVCFNTRKHHNESIYYAVDRIENAIKTDKQIIFYYYDLDENGEKKYRRDHHHYKAEPVSLVFYEDNYYLISYFPQKQSTVNYRIDRMESVEVIEDDISAEAKELRGSVAGYTESVFKMYRGEPTDVTLQFDQSLTGAVYDKFGEDTKMLRINDTTIIAAVKVQASPTFWGWVAQFGAKIKIIEPSCVSEQYAQHIEGILKGGKEIV